MMSPEATEALRAALCGRYTLSIGNEAEIICGPLPGRALTAATVVDDVLYVCVDLDKGAAPRHAKAMLEEWGKALFCADVPQKPQEVGQKPCPLSLAAA